MFQQSINEARAQQRRQDYMREAADERMLRSAHSAEADEAGAPSPAEPAAPARGFVRGLLGLARRRRGALDVGKPIG